ncbi:MAG: clan AA aspartic protease [Deltaproteobacteria bacterium]|nr:clan AA aspartic protease [Deltaproteobacteria bacterium]
MRGWTTGLILIFVLLPGLALADIYYWVDDQGTQYYTTSLDSIPEPYRSKAIPLPLPKSPPAPPELTPYPAQKRLTKIPFRPGSPVLVSAKINSAGPVTLILDTGSDRTLVAPSALSRLGISTENAPRGILKGVTGASYVDAVWVNSVEVGEAKVGPLLIIAYDADLKEAEGLLGRDFLANFNVTIDSKERVVTLAPN